MSRPAWFLAAIAFGLFVPLTLGVIWASQPYFDWDLAVSQSIQSVHGPGLESLTHAISMADNNVVGPSVLVFVACVVLAFCRAWREIAVLIGVVLVGQGLWVASGKLVGRPRPDPQLIQVLIEEDNIHGFPSFPSGHTVYYSVFFGVLWYLAFTQVKSAWLRWPLLCVFGALVVLVGFARIYLGAHWPSDIVGGYLLGAAVLAGGMGLHQRWCR